MRFPQYSELAQLAEHLTVNQVVAGSSPAFGAIKEPHELCSCGFFLLQCGRLTIEFATQMLVPPSVPLQSYGQLTSLRYAQLVTFPTLWRELRQKQYLIVFTSFPSIWSQKQKTRTQPSVRGFFLHDFFGSILVLFFVICVQHLVLIF